MFSKRFGYALRAGVYLALHGKNGRKVSLQELSKGLSIPYYFLEEIMRELVKQGIADYIKRPGSVYLTNARTLDTPLLELLELMDGSLEFNHCALNIRGCNAQFPCPLHKEFAASRDLMLQAMSQKTIGSMAESVGAGNTFLEREHGGGWLSISYKKDDLATE